MDLFSTGIQNAPFESLAGYSLSIFCLRWNIFEVSCDESCQDDTLQDVYSLHKHRSNMIEWLYLLQTYRMHTMKLSQIFLITRYFNSGEGLAFLLNGSLTVEKNWFSMLPKILFSRICPFRNIS